MQQVPQPISKPALLSPNSPYYHNLEDIERIIMSAQPRVVVQRSTNNELEKYGKKIRNGSYSMYNDPISIFIDNMNVIDGDNHIYAFVVDEHPIYFDYDQFPIEHSIISEQQ